MSHQSIESPLAMEIPRWLEAGKLAVAFAELLSEIRHARSAGGVEMGKGGEMGIRENETEQKRWETSYIYIHTYNYIRTYVRTYIHTYHTIPYHTMPYQTM